MIVERLSQQQLEFISNIIQSEFDKSEYFRIKYSPNSESERLPIILDNLPITKIYGIPIMVVGDVETKEDWYSFSKTEENIFFRKIQIFLQSLN